MADLQITFLGTGTSLGVPVIGCGCAVCSSPDPRDKRTRASIYVRSPECSWVIDTGADFRAQSLRENISVVNAVVYTHSHTDHIMGFDDLRVFCFSQRTLPIYASEETMSDLKRVFGFAFNHASPSVAPICQALATLVVEFAFLYWLYRRKVFLRV